MNGWSTAATVVGTAVLDSTMAVDVAGAAAAVVPPGGLDLVGTEIAGPVDGVAASSLAQATSATTIAIAIATTIAIDLIVVILSVRYTQQRRPATRSFVAGAVAD